MANSILEPSINKLRKIDFETNGKCIPIIGGVKGNNVKRCFEH